MTVLCSHQVVLLPGVVVRGQSDAGVGDTRLLRQANLRTKSSRKLRIPTAAGKILFVRVTMVSSFPT